MIRSAVRAAAVRQRRRAHSCGPRLSRQVVVVANSNVELSLKLARGVATQLDNVDLLGYQSLVPHGGLLSTPFNPPGLSSRRNMSNKPSDSNNNQVTLTTRLEPARRWVKAAPGKVLAAAKSGGDSFNATIMDKMAPIREKNVLMRYLCQFPISKQAIWTFLAVHYVGGIIHHGIIHLTQSLKLFWLNSKLGWQTARRIMSGEKVSAIERNRMRRALADIFLMFPFSAFIIIPGAELLIPLYVKVFPNAVPRPFAGSEFILSAKAKNTIQKAQAKIELATFLHDTLDEMTRKQSVTNSAKMVEFMKFAAEVRTGGRWVTNEDFKKYAPLFQDELTIDKMDRKTLDSLCRIFHVNLIKRGVMGYHRLPVTPSTQALRVELKKRIHELKYIDKEWMEVINKSGIDIVPEEDLQELSRERGMRALGLTRDRLERQYLDWVELSTDPKISDSMLAYTRMLYLPNAIEKMGSAMEVAIQKKTTKKPTKTSGSDTAPTPLTPPLAGDRITKKHIEALAASIRSFKRDQKPLEARKDWVIYRTNKLAKVVEEDKAEGIKSPVLSKIESITSKTQSLAETLPVEEHDVEHDVMVLSKELSKELDRRGVSEDMIQKIIFILMESFSTDQFVERVDTNKDGDVSLTELEAFVNHYLTQMDDNCSFANSDELMAILEKLPVEPVIPAAELIQTGPISVDKASEIVLETPPVIDIFDDATKSDSKRTQV